MRFLNSAGRSRKLVLFFLVSSILTFLLFARGEEAPYLRLYLYAIVARVSEDIIDDRVRRGDFREGEAF